MCESKGPEPPLSAQRITTLNYDPHIKYRPKLQLSSHRIVTLDHTLKLASPDIKQTVQNFVSVARSYGKSDEDNLNEQGVLSDQQSIAS